MEPETTTPANATPQTPTSTWGTPAGDTTGLRAMLNWERTQLTGAAPVEAAPVATAPQPPQAPPAAAPSPTPAAPAAPGLESMLLGNLSDRIAQGVVDGITSLANNRPTPPPPAPGLPRPADPEALLTDAGALTAHVANSAAAAVERTRWEAAQREQQLMQTLQPDLQAARAMGALGPQILRNEMARAEHDAEEMMLARGVPRETFRAALPRAMQTIQNMQGTDADRARAAIDPHSIAAAVALDTFMEGRPLSSLTAPVAAPGMPGAPVAPGSTAAASIPAQGGAPQLPPGTPIGASPSSGVAPVRDDSVTITEHILRRVDPNFRFDDRMLAVRDDMVRRGRENISADTLASYGIA